MDPGQLITQPIHLRVTAYLFVTVSLAGCVIALNSKYMCVSVKSCCLPAAATAASFRYAAAARWLSPPTVTIADFAVVTAAAAAAVLQTC